MTSATIKLFLPRGNAKSLRTAEISNWTGKAVAAPRTELDELLAREELDKAGVYILIGSDPLTNAPRAYIDEARGQRTGEWLRRIPEFHRRLGGTPIRRDLSLRRSPAQTTHRRWHAYQQGRLLGLHQGCGVFQSICGGGCHTRRERKRTYRVES